MALLVAASTLAGGATDSVPAELPASTLLPLAVVLLGLPQLVAWLEG
jgi:hypothetical protein